MPVIPSQRALFDIPEDVAYFNCAYQGPQLKASSAAMIEGLRHKERPWQVAPTDFFSQPEQLRELLGQITDTEANNFALMPSASYGLATAAQALSPHLKLGDEILMIAETFPSTYLTWKRVSEETGASIKTVATPSDHDWTSAILDAMTPATKLLSLPHCHWATGAMIDVVLVSEAARAQGAFQVYDLTQSLTAIPFDFGRVKPDFVATAGYKWMLFPYALSSLYIDPKWHDARPLEETWMNREGAHIFEKLAEYSSTYQQGARRFDMGEKSMPALVPGGIAALEQIAEWGIGNISETLNTLNTQIASLLEEVGLIPMDEAMRAPNILGASSPDGLPDNLLPALADEKIFISRRGNSLRFAPYLHINEHDMDRLASGLRKAFKR